MSEIAIKVEGVGKRYRIGARQQGYKTLRERINDAALAPFRAMNSLTRRNGNSSTHHSSLITRMPTIRNPQSEIHRALSPLLFTL